MKIIVDSLSGPVKRALYLAGWRLDRSLHEQEVKAGLVTGFHPLHHCVYEQVSGQHMAKNFETMGDAIREFEKITGYDVIGDTDQNGCSIYTFFAPEQQLAVSGWDCGKYLYCQWRETPRKCLEALQGLGAPMMFPIMQ